MISVNKISKKYGKRYVFKNISFDIKDREKLLIIGPSGCGKTTLIRCLNGLNKVNSGNIFLNGVKINQIDDVTLKSKVGMVFQNYNLFPHLTVRENVALAPKLLKMGSDEEIDDLVKKLLSKVNIINKIDSYPSKLSGGEKQRVAIIRALMEKPKILLLDEPTSSLDPQMKKEVLELISKLKDYNMTIIVVSHELNFVKDFSSRIIFLDNKTIISDDTVKGTFSSENEIIKNFLKDIN